MMINKKNLKEFNSIHYFVFKISGTGIFSNADTEKIDFSRFFFQYFVLMKKLYVLFSFTHIDM